MKQSKKDFGLVLISSSNNSREEMKQSKKDFGLVLISRSSP